MTELIFFILGFIFAELIIPIVENLTMIIEIKTEVFKHKNATKVAKYNKEIKELTEKEDDVDIPIGFTANTNN